MMFSYLEIHFAVSATSQPEEESALASTVFFFHSIMFIERLSEPRATCFLDHLVTVTRSSTCTSLTSSFEKWLSGSSMGWADADGEKESLCFGEDWVLPSGLICVATSFLKTAEDLMVLASLFLSIFSSVTPKNWSAKGQRGIWVNIWGLLRHKILFREYTWTPCTIKWFWRFSIVNITGPPLYTATTSN